MAEEAVVTPEIKPEEAQQFTEFANKMSLLSGGSKTANEVAGKLIDFSKKVTPPANTPAQNTPANTTTAPVEEVTATITTDEKPVIETDDLVIEGIGTIKGTKAVAPATIYDTLESAFEATKKKLGIEAKTPTEFVEKTTKAMETWRTQAQKAGELEAKQKDITATFEKMPDDLRESFLAWTKGEDYKAPLVQANGIDFKKPADQQDKVQLVNQFFPNKFTKEDFEEHATTPNPAIDIAVTASLDKFNTIRTTRDTAAKNLIVAQQAYKKDFDASVEDSVSRITDELPMFTDKSAIEGIRAEVASLHQLRGTALAKVFLNDNGTVKKDAAARVALMLHGNTINKAYAERLSQLAASKATEQVVLKGADKPSQGGGHNDNAGKVNVEEKIKKKVDTFLPKKKSVY